MNSNMEKPYVVGIDIGGTNTVFGIVDARGTILQALLWLLKDQFLHLYHQL